MSGIGDTTLDRLLGGRVLLEQPRQHGFRATIDGVLLAAAVKADRAAAVLDAGCGSGAAALCLAKRCPELLITGLERDPELAALAGANVQNNALGQRVTIEIGDILDPPSALRRRSFAVVMSNPPFNAADGNAPRAPARRQAMVEAVSTAAWLDACLRRLAIGGWLILVQRADRLPAVLAALEAKAGAIEIIPLWPASDGRSAKRVLVRCRKGARGPAILRQGLVLHEATGIFTEAVERILRHGAALDDVMAVA